MDRNNYENNNDKTKSGSYILKSGLLVASLIFLLIIVLLTVKGCTVTKEDGTEASEGKGSEVVLVQDDEDKVDAEEPGEDLGEEQGNEGSGEEQVDEGNLEVYDKEEESTKGTMVETEGSENIPEDDKNVDVEDSESNDNSLFEVDEPALGETLETATLVSGKDVYLVDNSQYTYSISLIFPEGEKYNIVKYFCSKKIYDEVNQGETINAVYQKDKNGLISIRSISR